MSRYCCRAQKFCSDTFFSPDFKNFHNGVGVLSWPWPTAIKVDQKDNNKKKKIIGGAIAAPRGAAPGFNCTFNCTRVTVNYALGRNTNFTFLINKGLMWIAGGADEEEAMIGQAGSIFWTRTSRAWRIPPAKYWFHVDRSLKSDARVFSFTWKAVNKNVKSDIVHNSLANTTL